MKSLNLSFPTPWNVKQGPQNLVMGPPTQTCALQLREESWGQLMGHHQESWGRLMVVSRRCCAAETEMAASWIILLWPGILRSWAPLCFQACSSPSLLGSTSPLSTSILFFFRQSSLSFLESKNPHQYHCCCKTVKRILDSSQTEDPLCPFSPRLPHLYKEDQN